MTARADAEPEFYAGPAPCDWVRVDRGEMPSDNRVVLLWAEPSRLSLGGPGIFMGRFIRGKLRFIDRAMESHPSRPQVVAWCEFPPPPEGCG